MPQQVLSGVQPHVPQALVVEATAKQFGYNGEHKGDADDPRESAIGLIGGTRTHKRKHSGEDHHGCEKDQAGC